MDRLQLYKGTGKEIADQIRESNPAGRYRVIVLQETPSQDSHPGYVVTSLFNRLEGIRS